MKSPFKAQASIQDISTISIRRSGPKKEHQWSGREVDWYISENRFIFVAQSALNLQRWLTVLRWLISPPS